VSVAHVHAPGAVRTSTRARWWAWPIISRS
jgi:hypothetical protein